MLIPLLQLIAGFILLIWGADRLVTGASALARNAGISPLVIGLTIVGFGTSAPELVTSAVASFQGNPALAVGNALGSNIANVGLILGITALLYPIQVHSGVLRREAPVLLLIMLVTLVLMFDLRLELIDGLILSAALLMMTGWMAQMGLKGNRDDPLAQDLEAEIPDDMSTSRAVLWTVVGLIILPLSSKILVDGAVALALLLGVPEVIVGLTVIAFGTSLPELAAAAASALKQEDDLAVGNILGSNMFNLLGVLGIAALVQPMNLDPALLYRDTSVMFGITLLFFGLYYWPGARGHITRVGGVVLLITFLVYQWFLIAPVVAANTGAG
ncbi:MAG: calcium/sodium antiporter [Xanthomonadales bacterium]|nr:calcium/sodium antiporter [Xanthomonadales bacterium]